MLLRRFYIQENENGMYACYLELKSKADFSVAPNPKPKRNRELNTEFASDVKMEWIYFS